MPEKLTLATAKTKQFGPGVTRDIPALEVMSFRLHREPSFDGNGKFAGWRPEGSHIEVLLVGDHGHVETVRVFEGQQALTVMQNLNTADLSAKSLMQRIMENVQAHEVQTDTDENGDPIMTRPYEGTLS